MDSTYRYSHIDVSWGLFLVSLLSPAFYQGDPHEPQFGYYLLTVGWVGILSGQIGWLANLGLTVSTLCKNSRYYSAIISVFNVAVALQFLTLHRLPRGSTGNYTPITGYGWGYYLWLSALIVMAIGQTSIACGLGRRFTSRLWMVWLLITAPCFYFYRFI